MVNKEWRTLTLFCNPVVWWTKSEGHLHCSATQWYGEQRVKDTYIVLQPSGMVNNECGVCRSCPYWTLGQQSWNAAWTMVGNGALPIVHQPLIHSWSSKGLQIGLHCAKVGLLHRNSLEMLAKLQLGSSQGCLRWCRLVFLIVMTTVNNLCYILIHSRPPHVHSSQPSHLSYT